MTRLNTKDFSALTKHIYNAISTNGCMHVIAIMFDLNDETEKALTTYIAICNSFLLQVLNEAATPKAEILEGNSRELYYEVETMLKFMGGRQHQIMYLVNRDSKTYTTTLSGPSSAIVGAVKKFCSIFNAQVKYLFEKQTSFLTTSAALDTTEVRDEEKVKKQGAGDWSNVRMLFVDDNSLISSTKELEMFDCVLRKLKQEPSKIFGGLCIVFTGHIANALFLYLYTHENDTPTACVSATQFLCTVDIDT